MTVLSERTHTLETAADTGIPLVEWQDCLDVVFDSAASEFDGECTQHDGCRSIL